MQKAAFTALVILAMAGAAVHPACAASIGLAAPLSGTTELLGQQMRAGAEAAISAAGDGASIEVVDTQCSAEGGKVAADFFVLAQVAAVTGFLCTEAIEAAMPILTRAGIPVITTGVRIDSLTDGREKTGWPVYRLAPRADGELAAASRILTERWRDDLFAIIDDGTIYGRELAEGFRLAAEQAGLRPVYTDTFRPQLENQIALAGRLRRAGATHVFAGGDQADLAILGRDARELGYDLVIAGGEALRAAPDTVDLVPGTLMIAPADWTAMAEPAVLARLAERAILPNGYVLPTYAAVEIALRARQIAGDDDASVLGALSNETFRTVLGPVRFDDKGDWTGEHYRLFRYDGSAFQPMD
jgi:branched-chain amino acid transport system substrate-binding protein